MSTSVPEMPEPNQPKRRAFFRGVFRTIGIGFVAAAGLGNTSPANADPHLHCEYTTKKMVWLRCYCNTYLEDWRHSCTGCGSTCFTITKITGVYCTS
jgi:hypothetical protein